MHKLKLSALIAVLAIFPGTAFAYIGPGAGAGAIAVVLGVLGALAMAFLALLWYPIKRIRRKRKLAKDAQADDNGSSGSK